MKLHNIAINNLRRRKVKVFFLVSGLLVGVASVVALVSTTGILEEDIAHKMDEFGANILITPKSEALSLTYGGISLGGIAFDVRELPQEELAKIKTIKNSSNIRIVSPKVFGVFEIAGRKGLAVGVDFAAERSLKKWWEIVGYYPKTDKDILVGHEAAGRFGLPLGASLEINGHPFTIAAVLNPTGSQDDDLVFMSLPVAQEVFGKQGKVNMVEIAALCKNCPISEIVDQIASQIPEAKVTAVQQVVAGRMETIQNFRRFSLGISGLVLLVGSLVVFVTMMGSVTERTREIGILSAIGFRRSHIMRIILLEALLVSLLAGFLGYLMGIGIARGLISFLLEHTPHFVLDAGVALGAVILSVVCGVIASLYPALAAAKMDPSEALRAL